MDVQFIIPIIAAMTFLGAVGLMMYRSASARNNSYRRLKVNAVGQGSNSDVRDVLDEDDSGEAFDKVNTQLKKQIAKKPVTTLEERLFRAGIFTDQQKRDYNRLRVLCPTVSASVGIFVGMLLGPFDVLILSGLCGLLLGFYIPLNILDRREKARHEEIVYYLPLVIEQVSIGVSSSLDVGPCIQRIVQMAEERDTHNPVSELLRYAEYYVKSGANLEEALNEVGRLSGNHDLKHAFMALGQVAKFGGEISRQLQELADAVTAQREARIEEKIKKLELAATAPVALVFFGYLVILLVGFGLQIITNM